MVTTCPSPPLLAVVPSRSGGYWDHPLPSALSPSPRRIAESCRCMTSPAPTYWGQLLPTEWYFTVASVKPTLSTIPLTVPIIQLGGMRSGTTGAGLSCHTHTPWRTGDSNP